MDLKTLKTLHVIVKYGSFIRAAEEMNYAQSTVTMQIQKLEADLGVQLIERGKKTRLTEAGRLFYEQSLDIVHRMEQLQANMAEIQTGEAGSVRIGVTEPTASCRLPNLLKAFLTEYPKIRVSVEISNTPALTEQLLRGDIDFALCSSPAAGTDVYFHPLFQEEFAVLLPADHPLAINEVIEPTQLQGHRLLITSATCPYRKRLDMVLQESGIVSLDTMEINSMTALKNYVESGLGIALVPKILLAPQPLGAIARPMKGAPIDMLVGLVCNTPDNPLRLASAQLYHYVMQELQSL